MTATCGIRAGAAETSTSRYRKSHPIQSSFKTHCLFALGANIPLQTEATISLDTPFDEMQSLEEFAEVLASSTIRQLFLRSSTACALSPSTIATYSASMMARRGQGGGNFSALVKHQYSDRVSIEVRGTDTGLQGC